MANPLDLGSPTHVAIGATDLDASINWWTGLGFGVTTENTLEPEVAMHLFGLDGEIEQIELRVDEAPGGAIWLVQVPPAKGPRGPFDSGPHAVGLYTTDLDASLALAPDLGAQLGGRLEHRFGTLPSEEASVIGPDGSVVVFIAVGERSPSVLDIHPEWLHSEIHSIVSTVRSADAANRFWGEQLGMTVTADDLVDSGLGTLLQLPPSVGARRTTVCDEFLNPIRSEFIEFVDFTGRSAAGTADMVSTWPLPPARPLGCFTVADVAASAARMFRAGATFGEIVDLGNGCAIGGSKAIWGLDPNGIRFILAGH